MKEFLQNIFQSSNERIKNPFIGSFFISLVFFNWKPILTITFSDQSIEDRIIYVSNNFNKIENNLYYPLLFSLLYVVVLPYFMLLIEFLGANAKKGRKANLLKEKIIDLKNKQLIAIEERKYEEEKAGSNEISELNTKIQELIESNEEKQKTIDSVKIDFNELKKEKNKLEQYVSLENPDSFEFSETEKAQLDTEYYEFLETEVSTYFENIGAEISQFKSIPKNTNSIIIEKLIYSGLIKRIIDEENHVTYYNLTKKGTYFWKNYVLSKRILSKQEFDRANELPF